MQFRRFLLGSYLISLVLLAPFLSSASAQTATQQSSIEP